ncbi:unnamed protein product [Polarella glacialis]|uniref:Fe2OG dioxygenase domain-containing protein n=1 Tax=Polarella glacialis TaxID=89957 RepID=A0A813GFX5_POLGL|nr:unnamed protein product [Polarella glacialis]
MHLLEGVACELERHGYRGSFAHQVPQLLQLSCYPAGSSHGYDRHLDCNLQSVFDLGVLAWLRATGNRARVLTAMVYLNDEDWLPSSTANSPGGHDGGELRVFHGVQWFPLAADAGAGEWRDYTDIAQRGGTLVIFNSRVVEHQVLPTRRQDRYALTCWVFGQPATLPRALRPSAAA